MLDDQVQLAPFRFTPYNLQKIFRGNMFKLSLGVTHGLGTLKYEFKTGSKKTVHIVTQAVRTSGVAERISFIENAISVDGGPISSAPYNVNRITPTTSSVSFLFNPTTGAGPVSTIYSVNLIQGKKWKELAPEIILAKNSAYLITLTNSTGTAAITSFSFVWYETSS